MMAALTLAPNAQQQRAIAELPLTSPRTMAELANALCERGSDAEHIAVRLRHRGLRSTAHRSPRAVLAQ